MRLGVAGAAASDCSIEGGLLPSSSDGSLPGGAVRLIVSELSWLAPSARHEQPHREGLESTQGSLTMRGLDNPPVQDGPLISPVHVAHHRVRRETVFKGRARRNTSCSRNRAAADDLNFTYSLMRNTTHHCTDATFLNLSTTPQDITEQKNSNSFEKRHTTSHKKGSEVRNTPRKTFDTQ